MNVFILNNDVPEQDFVLEVPSVPPDISHTANTATQTGEKRGGATLELMGHILHAVTFLGRPFSPGNLCRDLVGLSQHGGSQRRGTIRRTGCVPFWDPRGGESEKEHWSRQEE